MKRVAVHCGALLFTCCAFGYAEKVCGQSDQPEPLDRITAGDQAYRAADQARRRAIGTQIDLQDYIRWRAGLPNRRWLYADPPGAAGRFSTTQPSLYGRIGPAYFGDGVFEPWPVWPGGIYGYRFDNPVEQPAGDEIRSTGPNGYTYGPVYNRTPPVQGPVAPQSYVPRVAAAPAVDHGEELETAIAAFLAGRYQPSLAELADVLAQRPENPLAELLRVQAEFALGDYAAAAANLHRVLPQLPQKEWGQVVRDYRRFYGGGDKFRGQLRALEAHLDDKPGDLAGRLLLAYEYGYLGHPKPAVTQLEQVLDATPQDRLAKQLLDAFSAMIVAPEPEEPVGPRKF